MHQGLKHVCFSLFKYDPHIFVQYLGAPTFFVTVVGVHLYSGGLAATISAWHSYSLIFSPDSITAFILEALGLT